MAKDSRFQRKTEEQKREAAPVSGNEIYNNTIRNEHLLDGSITGNKLQALSVPRPIHYADQLSTTTSGWVRVAQLKNLSGVEFWLKATTSGAHNIAKFVGTYCFMGNGSPQITFSMVCNARFGTGFTDVRVVYKGTYDDIYFEVYVPQNAYIAVSQVSAFGQTFENFSNITLTAGGIPSGYSAYPNNPYYASTSSLNFGSYDSGILTL